jgi:hypothetical protein
VYFSLERQLTRRRYTRMRELEVLDNGYLKLDWEERKAFLKKS